MHRIRLTLAAALALVLTSRAATSAQEVRYYQLNGIVYQETRRVIPRPIVQTRMEPREQTVYHEKLHTEYRDTYQDWYTPVVEYQCVPTAGTYDNPCEPSAGGYYLTPTCRYEIRREHVRVPVVQRQWVPEKQVVQVPVTSQQMAQEEVITRVPIEPNRPQTLPPGGMPPVGVELRGGGYSPAQRPAVWQPSTGRPALQP